MTLELKPRFLLDKLHSSLWIVPLGLVLAMMALARALIALDAYFGIEWQLISSADVDAARSMLQAVASSMITVAALVFSLTLAVLAQVSGQYSPRVLRNFLRDRLNQTVMGVLLGIFAYCLVVLSGMGTDGGLSPLAVTGGFIGALVGVVFLIYFIHHIARAMQAENILAAIEEDAYPVFERFYPRGESGEEGADEAPSFPRPGATVRAAISGYIQDIDLNILLDVAEDMDTVIHVPVRVGDFLAPGQTVAVFEPGMTPDDDCAEAVRDAFSLGRTRSIQQDPAFGLRQLVDVALKSLSPAINDTTSAIMALDRIGVLLRIVAARRLPARQRLRHGKLRLSVERPDFEDMVSLGFDQIRRCGSDNPTVLARMLALLAELTAVACDARRRALLCTYAQRTLAAAERSIEAPEDIDWLRDLHRRLGFATPRTRAFPG